ncbi:hypothetical protein DQ04_07401040 [Trypanosoma grayi]|uniref:hypothetical protein n=1 Tax=Trypanosoma grayi TaxID=71804 RepID=UPI0004F4AAE7|nr:hypothetical protein DQ04_07401040 [Trypanosoma grayi]KEG08349.1 hypothetical protein DQ04_07401040 [Trypanosoma grayi]
MPVIYLQAGDGTRIAVPEEAAALSAVVRRALDNWTEAYGPPPPPPEDDDDDDDNANTNGSNSSSSSSDSERTPDRINDDDDDDDETSRTRSVLGNPDDDDDGTEEYRNNNNNEDDTDRTVSILDEECGSRTPSPCPSPETPTRTAATTSRGRRRASRRGSSVKSKRESHENGSATPEHLVLHNSNRSSSGSGSRELVAVNKEDSATPSTLDEEDVDNDDDTELDESSPPRQLLSTSSDAPLLAESISPTAHARPLTSPVAPTTADASDTHNRRDGSENTGSTDNLVEANAAPPSSSGGSAPVVRRRDSVTVFADVPAAGDEEERFLGADRMPPLPPPMISPHSLTNDEHASPSSYHQRTPCMICDEDDGLLLGGSVASSISEDVTPHNRSRERTSPASGAEPASPNALFSGKNTEFGGAHSGRHRASLRSNTLDNAGSSGGDAAACGVGGLVEDVVAGPLHQCARITDREIVIELQSCLPPNLPHAAGGGGAEEADIHSTPLQSVSQSQTLCQPSGRTSQSPTPLVSVKSGVSGSTNQMDSAMRTTGNNEDENQQPQRPSLVSDAVQLCAEYLRHFAGDGQQKERLHPTPTPEPLPAPLVCFLTPWERNFLYRGILGHTDEQMALAMAITQHAPTMSFIHPAPFLRNPDICTALLAAPPASGRVALLVDVMRAAGVLQISSLQNLCAAWCADFMIRVSYASIDYFEAAALVRQCFHVRSDWTKRELDCLKLENEWPANEEE